MPIAGDGWELHVNRLGLQRSGAEIRTYGTYRVYHDGNSVCGLHGYLCEAMGPGDNEVAGCGRRVAAGRYPLWTQFGRYRTIGYSDDKVMPGADPMPALRLESTKNRTGILIHPGYPPKLYLSSVGCLNPTSPLSQNEAMNFWDSRSRVIALIIDLREFAPQAFENEVATQIANTWVVIDGEPMTLLQEPLAV